MKAEAMAEMIKIMDRTESELISLNIDKRIKSKIVDIFRLSKTLISYIKTQEAQLKIAEGQIKIRDVEIVHLKGKQ